MKYWYLLLCMFVGSSYALVRQDPAQDLHRNISSELQDIVKIKPDLQARIYSVLDKVGRLYGMYKKDHKQLAKPEEKEDAPALPKVKKAKKDKPKAEVKAVSAKSSWAEADKSKKQPKHEELPHDDKNKIEVERPKSPVRKPKKKKKTDAKKAEQSA